MLLPFGSKDSVQSVNPNAFVPFKKDKQYADLVYNRPNDEFDRSSRPVPSNLNLYKYQRFIKEI